MRSSHFNLAEISMKHEYICGMDTPTATLYHHIPVIGDKEVIYYMYGTDGHYETQERYRNNCPYSRSN